jgi:hypothetical protein
MQDLGRTQRRLLPHDVSTATSTKSVPLLDAFSNAVAKRTAATSAPEIEDVRLRSIPWSGSREHAEVTAAPTTITPSSTFTARPVALAAAGAVMCSEGAAEHVAMEMSAASVQGWRDSSLTLMTYASRDSFGP